MQRLYLLNTKSRGMFLQAHPKALSSPPVAVVGPEAGKEK